MKSLLFSIILLFLLLVYSIISAQNNNTLIFQGVIKDSITSEPLIGVNVFLKGTNKGTITNTEGIFRLDLTSGNHILIISYIGYIQKEITLMVNREISMEIVLVPDITELEEVKITSQRKFFGNMEYGREIPTIGAEVIGKQNVNNASDLLHGRLAGIWATKTSGAPGDHQKIRIRGQNSLFTSAEPLYVVDGVPVPIVNLSSLGIADLNISDIENVTVLKDASSTALYGFQGGNGVVLIDTKTGNKKEISFTARTGYQWFDNFYDLMSSKEQITTLNAASSKGISTIVSNYPQYSDTLCNQDRQNEIFESGISQDYQLSAGGSAGKLKYYISGSHTNQQGILPHSEYKRYTFSSRLGRNFGKKVIVSLVYRGSKQENRDNQDQYKGNRLLFEGISRSPCLECTPHDLIYTPDNVLKQRIFYNYAPLNYNEYPKDIADLYHHSLDIGTQSSNLSVNYRLSDHISFNAMGSMMYRRSEYNMNYKYFYFDDFLPYPVDILLKSKEEVILLNHQYSLSYNNTFRKNAVGLVIAYRNYTDNLWWHVDTIQGTLNNNSYLRNSMAAYGPDGSVLRELASYMGNASYNYSNKYFLSLVGNLSHVKEGLHIDYYTFFPSVAASWDIAQEKTLQNIGNLNSFKIYANWGVSGNYPLNGLSNDLYDKIKYTHGSQNHTYYPYVLQFANHYLKHESTSEFDLGSIISLYKNRLTISGVHYWKKIDQLIIQRDIPDYYAGGKEYYNIGEIDIIGNELTIEAMPIKTRDFFWRLNFNVSSSNQIVKKLYEEKPLTYTDKDIMMPVFIIEQGKELGSIYGYKSYGKWTSTDETEKNNLYVNAGGLKFLNADSSNIYINEKDLVVIGNSIPKLTGNIISSIQFKNFSLEMHWYSAWGFEKYNATRAGNIMTAVNRDVNTYISDSITLIRQKIFYQSSEFIDDASFIRLKTLTLGFEPDKPVLGGVKINVAISVENILTITHYKGYDPEATIFTNNNFSDNAIDRGAVPNPKSVYLTFHIKF